MQAAVDPCGRSGSHVLAMPTSFAGRMMQSSGRKGMDLITPIVPCGLSNENGKPSLRYPRAWYVRTRYANVFGRSPAELKAINDEALTKAAEQASGGQAVTICPGGKVAEAAHVPWQGGLGRIVRRLSPEAQETTQIAVFRPDTFSVKGVMKALLLQDFGMRRSKNRQTIVLRAASLGTANELFGSLLDSDDPHGAQQISDTARRHYIDQFADHI